jgi:hypothetical protein
MNSANFRRAAWAAATGLLLASSGSAHAIFRAYLSVNGNDMNACTLPAPCRLLPAALAAVDAGGEIWMLDSANFNTSLVSVTKSVTILAIPGQLGSLVGNNGTAISISGAGIEVTLQNLNILSIAPFGDIGVLIGNASKVTIADCNIFGFKSSPNQIGIWITPGANSPQVSIIRTTVRNNSTGIIAAGNAHVTISKSHVVSNVGIGVWATSGASNRFVNVVVSDTVASNNGTGFAVTGLASADTFYSSAMYVTRSVASGNSDKGFTSEGGITGLMSVGDSIATDNGTGFNNGGGSGAFATRGNNTVTGNGNNVNGALMGTPGV